MTWFSSKHLAFAATAVLLAGMAAWGIGHETARSPSCSALQAPETAEQASPQRAPWQRFETASGIGSKEDPYARLRYRWMRLRDPATGEIPANIRSEELAFAERLPKDLRKSSSWVGRGPANVGGRSRALAYDVTDTQGETILAGGVSGGMWRTTDGGQSWARTFTKSQRPSVTTIDQDPRSGATDTWYVGTGERIGNSAVGGGGAFYRGDGIYKSIDGGQSWSQLSSTTSEETAFDSVFDYVYRVRVDPTNGNVYAATFSGIQRSTDGGSSWTAVLGDLSGDQVSVTDVAVTTQGVLYATMSSDGDSGERGLWRSTDGVNWTNITPSGWPSGQDTYFRTVLAVNPSDETEVWFLSQAPGEGPVGADGQGDAIGHILWEYDADAASGSRWTDYSDYLPTRGDNRDAVDDGAASGDFYSQGGYDLVVAVHPSDDSKVFVGGRNLWRLDVSGTATGADTWIGGYTYQNDDFAPYQPSGSDEHHPDQHTLAFQPGSPDVMLTGSDGGVHRTTDNRASGDGGVTYQSLNDGYITTQFYQVCQNADASDDHIVGGMQDNGTWSVLSTSTTDNWTDQFSGDGATCEITNAAGGNGVFWYVSAQNGQVFQFEFDSNYSFQSGEQAYPSGASNQLFVHPFEIDPSDAAVMYYPGGTSLWRNTQVETDPTSGWTELTGAAGSNYVITAVAASETNNAHVLYYGGTSTAGDAAKIYRVTSANTVSSSSFTRNDVSGTQLPAGGYVSDVVVDPRDSDKVLVAISNYNTESIFYTTDGGQNWTNVEGNLGGSTGPSVRAVEVLPQPALSQTTYYAATSTGLYSATSLSSSASWTEEGPTSIGNVVVDDVEARDQDGFVLAGTHGNGVYSATVDVPVELARFEATTSGSGANLAWTTSSETNNAGFEVQHRYQDETYEKIGFVDGAGTTNQSTTYRYETGDLRPGRHTFRLRQVDTDGAIRQLESTTVMVSPSGAYELTAAAPNPFRASTSMQLSVREAQHVRVDVFNSIGQRVRTVYDDRIASADPVDLSIRSRDLASGAYFVRVQGETFEATRKVVLVE